MNKLTLPVSLAKLVELIGDQTTFKPQQIVDLIAEAKVCEKDLLEWADFEHDPTEGYGRKLVYKSDHFEVMVMSWAPGDGTAIHNHGYTQWGAVKSFGKLEHSIFNLEGEVISTLFKQKLVRNEIIPVNQELIHQMTNFSGENVLSLHVYGTSKAVDGITDNSLIYEIGKGEIQIVDGGVFYDLAESKVAVSDAEIYADRLTLIGHFTSLLNHYSKTGARGPQYQKAVNYFHDRSFESRLITELEMDSKWVLYLVELKKARTVLKQLGESTSTIDAILREINDPDNLS